MHINFNNSAKFDMNVKKQQNSMEKIKIKSTCINGIK